MDLLDIITGKAGMTYTGRYYAQLPDACNFVTSNGADYFDYEYIDVTEWRYQRILGNIIATDRATETIKTRSPIKFRPNSYIALQDGKVYLVSSTTEDRTLNKQAGAFALTPLGADKIIRLIEVEDIYGIGGAPDEADGDNV